MPPITVEGVCEGRIAFAPSGNGGFGYDPIFFIPEYNCTMAELDETIKNQISHRARAAVKAKEILREWIKNTSEVLRIKLRKSDDDGSL